jgi:hypothetical protein
MARARRSATQSPGIGTGDSGDDPKGLAPGVIVDCVNGKLLHAISFRIGEGAR